MPTVAEPKTTKKQLMQPEEAFWTKYSSHHEFPLAGMASVFVHGLAVGLMIFVAFVLNASWHDPAAQPPHIDVVQIDGGEGMGLGAGPAGGSPDGDNRPRTEMVEATPMSPMRDQTPMPMTANMPPELAIPTISLAPETNDPLDDLKNIETQAAKVAAPKVQPTSAEKPNNPAPIIKAGANIGKGGRGPLGIGGNGPGGFGGGLGKNPNGTGMGGKGITRQQWLANRWKFGLTGDPKTHVDKLVAVGVLYAFPPATEAMRHPLALQQAYVIHDLKKRPAQPRLESFEKYRDSVLWLNNDRDSVFKIAKELRLAYTPPYTLMLLSKEREERIAQEETRYLQEKGLTTEQVEFVHFDFRLKGGSIEPVAVNHELRR